LIFSYWDNKLDLMLMENKIALNLLYLQTVCDMERGWIVCSHEHKNTLATLQSQGAKKQVSLLYYSSIIGLFHWHELFTESYSYHKT